MGARPGAKIDKWLGNGGLVVAASDRAARALQTAFHQRRRAEGLSAWPAPEIQTWSSFVRRAWQQRNSDGRMLLNPSQERALWNDILAGAQNLATLLDAPRLRLADLAMQAHELLCSYAPRYLNPSARSTWDRDAGAFSRWLSAFDAECTRTSVLSPNRAPLELIHQLQYESSPRPPLLAAGFDRLLPVQQSAFDAWGTWETLTAGDPTSDVVYYAAANQQNELAACAAWCAQKLAADPNARLLVITQDIASRRGEIEREFLRISTESAPPLFEFSLGIPLSQVPLARAASLLLRWLDGSLLESEIDWLLSTGLTTTGSEESLALQACMRALRNHGLARPEWSLKAFITQRIGREFLPSPWLRRISDARQHLAAIKSHRHSPLEWAALVPQLLQAAGLPGDRRLASNEFQAWNRWEQALDTCASLGFDGRPMAWSDFLSALSRTLSETLFAPESADAPIQIAGPAESAGLTADAFWFLGATEEAWPTAGATHPFLPRQVQRACAMPHASPRHDWDLAHAITTRLLASAPSVRFSYARQSREADTRPSRLIAQLAGPAQPLPAELAPRAIEIPSTIPFDDFSRIPFPPNKLHGGSSVLTSQSQCAFKAFAIARLGAQGWEPAEFGLSASQRGLLLHAVLHSVWSGPPHGLRSLADLLALTDRESFVADHVQRVLRDKMPEGIRERMPQRYLELEGVRLTRLISEWLDYEATRLPFTVAETEATRTVDLAGISLTLRFDRIDRLNNNSLLVLDYKTGNVSSKSWDLPRPDDVQLPLYAGFALGEEPGGLLFARLRAGQSEFVGAIQDATATLIPSLNGRDSLNKNPLTAEQMNLWREHIEGLARDFVAGRADVGPREYPGTCERCELHVLCRIQENQAVSAEEENEEDADE